MIVLVYWRGGVFNFCMSPISFKTSQYPPLLLLSGKDVKNSAEPDFWDGLKTMCRRGWKSVLALVRMVFRAKNAISLK